MKSLILILCRGFSWNMARLKDIQSSPKVIQLCLSRVSWLWRKKSPRKKMVKTWLRGAGARVEGRRRHSLRILRSLRWSIGRLELSKRPEQLLLVRLLHRGSSRKGRDLMEKNREHLTGQIVGLRLIPELRNGWSSIARDRGWLGGWCRVSSN